MKARAESSTGGLAKFDRNWYFIIWFYFSDRVFKHDVVAIHFKLISSFLKNQPAFRGLVSVQGLIAQDPGRCFVAK